MIDPTTAVRRIRTLGDRALPWRDGTLRLDPEAATVRVVAAGLVLGVASLLLIGADSHRNTDTKTERVARISPVGSVTVAAMSPAPQAATAGEAAGVDNDS